MVSVKRRASPLLHGGEAQVGALHRRPLLISAVDCLGLEDGATLINPLQLLSSQFLIAREVSHVDRVFAVAPPPNLVQQLNAPEVFRYHGVLTWDESELASFFGVSEQQWVSTLPVLLHKSFDLGRPTVRAASVDVLLLDSPREVSLITLAGGLLGWLQLARTSLRRDLTCALRIGYGLFLFH